MDDAGQNDRSGIPTQSSAGLPAGTPRAFAGLLAESIRRLDDDVRRLSTSLDAADSPPAASTHLRTIEELCAELKSLAADFGVEG